MQIDKPWFDRLLDQTVDYFLVGIVGGSAFNMLKGMYNSPKGERLIRGLQAVRMNAPRFGSNCGIFGGLSSVLESFMIHVRQKDDPWNSVLSDATAVGLVKMHRGLGPTSHSALIFGSGMALLEGYLIVKNRVQSPQPDFEELDKKQKRWPAMIVEANIQLRRKGAIAGGGGCRSSRGGGGLVIASGVEMEAVLDMMGVGAIS
ncbi:unnamed protein product [Fraxinus pennsylvanica]|uniref:Uncharacterized protein n=1 Tax=Fraxinus pennsylvanica TaxID=56036 RepID=A0AAD2E5U4_9LAMI|nr:unnamed protein product [Fraxinus pennsylvanica]